jgi:hypothetical protein
MPLKVDMPVTGAALLLAVLLAAPALADVKTGVDAWSRGDYSAAVKEWQGPAAAGDPDAMFNLAQAYRLGRGVALDAGRAEALYAQAAAAGHLQAADTYGLMLFQDGRREAALPYLQAAARRGDARSQYLLGIAHFNGDLVGRDWTRAYALVSLANAAGLPQATQALAQMDQHIPLAQRQQAAGLAEQLRGEAESTRSRQLAAADLAPADQAPVAGMPSRPVRSAASAMPRAPGTVAVSPSIAAARAAVAEASRATGTESPATAGASFARPRQNQVAALPAAIAPTPARATRAETPRAAPTTARTRTAQAANQVPALAVSSGAASRPWRVQLGAFSVAGNAQRLWDQVSGRAELAGKARVMVAAGRVTKLQAGGFTSRGAADAACRTLRNSGHECLVVPS